MNVRLLALVCLVVGLGACTDEGPVAGPGTITATLRGPNASEGAAVLTLLGDDVGAVTGLGDTEVFVRDGADRWQVVLVNQVGGTLSFEVTVADTTQPPAFVVQEVAGPDDELRSDVAGYTVEFTR